MALRQPTHAAAATVAFEDDDVTASIPATAANDNLQSSPVAAVQAAPSKPVAPSTAVVSRPAANAVTQTTGTFGTLLARLTDAEGFEGVEHDTLPRLKVDGGAILTGEDHGNQDFGSSIVLEVYNFHPYKTIAPDADMKKDKDAGKLYRLSWDGRTVQGGADSLESWAEKIRDAGYEVKQQDRAMLHGMILTSEKPTDFEGKLVALDLSGQSVKAWRNYVLQRGFRVSRGLLEEHAGPQRVKIVTERKKFGSTTFFIFNFDDFTG